MSYLPYVQKKNYGVNFKNGKDWIPIVALDTINPPSLVISYSKYASLSVIIERDNFTKLKLNVKSHRTISRSALYGFPC